MTRRGGWKDQERVSSERVDVDRGGWQRDAWRAVREALGGRGVREVERDLARGGDHLHAPEEDVGGREEREARVVMVVVVPAEKVLQPSSSVELAIEAPGVVREGSRSRVGCANDRPCESTRYLLSERSPRKSHFTLNFRVTVHV